MSMPFLLCNTKLMPTCILQNILQYAQKVGLSPPDLNGNLLTNIDFGKFSGFKSKSIWLAMTRLFRHRKRKVSFQMFSFLNQKLF